MLVNGNLIKGNKFAFDGCHKIYIIEDDRDNVEALELGYSIYDIENLPEVWEGSCSLRFINNWKLDNTYVAQFEEAEFEE